MILRAGVFQGTQKRASKLFRKMLGQKQSVVEVAPSYRFDRGGDERDGIDGPLGRDHACDDACHVCCEPSFSLVFVGSNDSAAFVVEFGSAYAANERQAVSRHAFQRDGVAFGANGPSEGRAAARACLPGVDETQA